MERYFAVSERNDYVNTILQVTFDYAADRKCMFSSFDPDICYLLASKQVRYVQLFVYNSNNQSFYLFFIPSFPVFFLTEGGTVITDDPRKNSLEAAIQFAQAGFHLNWKQI